MHDQLPKNQHDRLLKMEKKKLRKRMKEQDLEKASMLLIGNYDNTKMVRVLQKTQRDG